jgi:hypothetical protein
MAVLSCQTAQPWAPKDEPCRQLDHCNSLRCHRRLRLRLQPPAGVLYSRCEGSPGLQTAARSQQGLGLLLLDGPRKRAGRVLLKTERSAIDSRFVRPWNRDCLRSRQSHMPKYNSAALAHTIDHSPQETDTTFALICQCCGDTMEYTRKVSRFGVRPPSLLFVCPSCKHVAARQFKCFA